MYVVSNNNEERGSDLAIQKTDLLLGPACTVGRAPDS